LTNEVVIEARGLTKVYPSGGKEFKALDNVCFTIKRGEFIIVMGPSGSGKSTLMNIIGCLDRPTSGELYIEGRSITGLTDSQLAEIRREKNGFIFQSFNLISHLSALRNVALPLSFKGLGKPERESKAREMLQKMGIDQWANKHPSQLSGGEQQRVAIARALANDPAVIIADEPTGNLDSAIGQQVMHLLKSISKEGKTILLVTHDANLVSYGTRLICMKDGKIVTGRDIRTQITSRRTAPETTTRKTTRKTTTRKTTRRTKP
jgi:putative ABC transport system ATP-binding protein